MDLYLSDFIEGIDDTLRKHATVFEQTGSGSILPNISSQSKWHFSKGIDHIHLSDGDHVYNFHMPNGESEDDFPMHKLEDKGIHEFTSEGTAQIHRADPGMIYFTLQDGKKNPTYTLKHVNESQWRAIPKGSNGCCCPNDHGKQEKHANVDEQAFLAGMLKAAEEHGLFYDLLDKAVKGVDSAGRTAINGAMSPGYDPLMAAGIGAAGGLVYDQAKRNLYNTDEENENEGIARRAFRVAAPAALLGGTGALTRTAFPNYYNYSPLYTA